ncbi:hypothetical protein FSP39_006885 [Pinctada imbricata]|uniref:UspA domain-containing protein n=1 Tax=Pinctada imbricata TaxID=66713 RepID=A0AA89BYY4_PINIB|nr:hypothetical protein FSP39_006885 [Pinctada imbricata]
MGTADVQAVCNLMQEEETEQKKIQEELKSKLSKAGMRGCVIGKFGKPGEVIISISHNEKADVLVCGTRGLGKVRRTLMGSMKGQVMTVSGHAKAGPAIIGVSLAEKVDLIVCGCRGIGTFRRTLLGSVSTYLMHHAHVPVLVCKQSNDGAE